MQKKISFVVIFFAIASVSYGDLKNKIENINDTLKKVGNNQPDCTACSFSTAGNGNNIGTLMKSCVESICPKQE